MAQHEHGKMDITAQRATFEGAVKFTIRLIIFLIVLMIFLALFRT